MYKLHILPRALFRFFQGSGAFFRQSALKRMGIFRHFYVRAFT